VRVSVDQAAVLEEMRGAMQRTGSERRKLAVGELVEILQQSNGKAVSRRDLASMLRLPDRTVRALVEQARRRHDILRWCPYRTNVQVPIPVDVIEESRT